MSTGPYHRLRTTETPEKAPTLRAAVTAAMNGRERTLTIGLDSVTSLDDVALNKLICALRRLREVGGTVLLHVTRPDLLRTLSMTGLDRVFKVVSIAPQVVNKRLPAQKPHRLPLGRVVVTFALALVFLLAAKVAGFGQTTPADLTPEQIISKIVQRNPALTSFQAHVDVRLHTGVPFLNPTLEGMTYFKTPANYEVVFTKTPSYARGLDRLYSDSGDPASWAERFVISLAGEQVVNAHSDIILRLVQRVRGMIDHEDVAIDPRSWTIERTTYYYYNGGKIALDQTFREEGGYSVLSDQRAVIILPHIPHVVGTAHYSDYRFNVAVDDSVFTRRQTKDLGVK